MLSLAHLPVCGDLSSMVQGSALVPRCDPWLPAVIPPGSEEWNFGKHWYRVFQRRGSNSRIPDPGGIEAGSHGVGARNERRPLDKG